MGMLVFLGLVAALAAWSVGLYNRLVALKNRCDSAWEAIGVQCKRRHDLIPNLVETVRGMMEFEKSTLEAVIAARGRAVAARTPRESAAAEAGLDRALASLFAVAEQYPELKSNQNVMALQEELTNTENLITFSRQHYNDVANELNILRETFPAVLIANQFGFTSREYFKAPPEEVATVPTVDLRLRS